MLTTVLSPEITLISNINVSQFRELVLMLRVHSATWTGTGITVDVRLRASAPTDEDPAQTFRPTADLTKLTLTEASVAPLLVLSSPLTGFGTHVDLTVQYKQGSTSSATQKLTASADLSLKS